MLYTVVQDLAAPIEPSISGYKAHHHTWMNVTIVLSLQLAAA